MDYKKPQSTLVQGGAGIYPLTTADQVILADGTRLEKDGKINVDVAANSTKLGGKAPEYYIQPRNLLDNSDFRNPVNQRGVSAGSDVGYCIDRWRFERTGDCTYNVDDRGIFLYNSVSGDIADYFQIIANAEKYTGKNMTFAVQRNGEESPYVLNFVMGENNEVGYKNDAIKLIHYGGDKLYIRWCSTGWTEAFLWAALYEGSYTADTLPPYVPKGYAAELAECQRYYIEIRTQPVNGWCYDWGQVHFFVPTPTLMRQEKPSVTLNTASSNFYIGSTSYDATLIGGDSFFNGVLVKYSHAATVRGQCIIPEFSAKISADL